MKLFFYNRTSLSNVIIRKYFVCDISLDSIPRSCNLIQMTDHLLTTISGTGAAPLPGYHRHISLCHTHIQGANLFLGPLWEQRTLCYIAHGFSNNTIITSISMESLCKSIFSNSPRKQLLLYFLVRQQATARQSNTWSSSSNMSDPDDLNTSYPNCPPKMALFGLNWEESKWPVHFCSIVLYFFASKIGVKLPPKK